MKKILALFLLIPSLSPALMVESPDSGIGGKICIQEVPAISSLRQAMNMNPAEITPIAEGVAYTEWGKMDIRGVNLLFKGKYAEAIPILELAGGGTYPIGSDESLAIAHELLGDYKKALDAASTQRMYYSRKNLKPPVISIAVLNAKIKAGKTGEFAGPILNIPETVRSTDLIHLDQQNPYPRGPIQELFPAIEIKKALFEDLKNRLLFYKSKDPYVADLLYSYALLEANLGSPSSAQDILKLAAEYGFKDQALLQAQQERFQKLALMRVIRFIVITLLSLAALLLLIRYVRRRKWHRSLPVQFSVKSQAYLASQREVRPLSKHHFQGQDRF